MKGQEYLPVTSLDKRERNQNGPCMSRRELMTKVPAFWEVPSSVWRLARLEGELWSLEESTVKDLPNRDLHNLTADCAAALSPPDRYVSFEADRGWVLKAGEDWGWLHREPSGAGAWCSYEVARGGRPGLP